MSIAIPDDVEAVVFDLDGTVVRLAVDWASVADEVRARYRSIGVDATNWSVWDGYKAASEHGIADAIEELLRSHELAGAEGAERLPAAETMVTLDRPVGVCSLNAEAACRAALDSHGLLGAVDTVVGRDTVGPVKPHPAPLLKAIEGLSSTPAAAFYIGNREKDKHTARRAGVRFAYVSGDGPTE